MDLKKLIMRIRRKSIEKWINGKVMGVEIIEVRKKIIKKRNMRKRIEIDGEIDVVNKIGEGKSVREIDINGEGKENELKERKEKSKSRVDIVIDIEKKVKKNRKKIVKIEIIGIDKRILVVIRRKEIDEELSEKGGEIRKGKGIEIMNKGIIGK